MSLGSRHLAWLVLWALLVLLHASPSLAADGPRLRTYDGRYPIEKIRVTVVYFVPSDRTPLPDWRERVRYYCRRLEQFHAREFQGQSQLTMAMQDEPFVSDQDSSMLRAGDANFIFFRTLNEVQARLGFAREADETFPILLVLSDINWRELDDFWRLRAADGQFEGQIIQDRHFPGAASGGARAMYIPDRGVGWGLVSGDGWRVPYTGTDCVVYHEGVGHAIGLPHPEPQDDSVMSLAQYRFWLNQSWVHEAQKRQLGWQPQTNAGTKPGSLFTAFTAYAEPRVPRPDEEVGLVFSWPADARLRHATVRVQTELTGPWHLLAELPAGKTPDAVRLGRFDRPTPVSYRVEATLEDDQQVELWGYFQVRSTPETAPTPMAAPAPAAAIVLAAPRWSEAVELLPLIDPEQHRVSGEWVRHEGRLESNKQYGARIEIPHRPPAEYVLTAIVEPLDEPNGLILGQRSGDRRFLVLVNFQRPDGPPVSALEDVDGLNFAGNSTALRAELLKKNRLASLVCTVRREGVTVTCDGRPIIDWRGPSSRLSLSDYWKTPNDVLFLGAYDCRYRFHRLTLTPISDTSQPSPEPSPGDGLESRETVTRGA
ncbi:MAG: hypothetical protein KJ000_31370 [Pirellulaceae bacterium]|nr:hypothetical protein [Pirellulaceae bacterium]